MCTTHVCARPPVRLRAPNLTICSWSFLERLSLASCCLISTVPKYVMYGKTMKLTTTKTMPRILWSYWKSDESTMNAPTNVNMTWY
jgi:hypothetical protein